MRRGHSQAQSHPARDISKPRTVAIFLDEIGDLPLEMQAKLLRVIEERQVVRVGNTQPVSVDVRLLAATNVDLKMAVETSAFREDLSLLVRIFLDRFSTEHNLPPREMPNGVLGRLIAYSWPGGG